MITRLLLLTTAVSVAAAPYAARRSQAPSQAPPLTWEGRWLTGYASLCDLRPELWPEFYMQAGVRLELTTCAEVAKPAQPLAALEITVTNRDTLAASVQVPRTSEVVVRASGRSVHATALFLGARGIGGNYARPMEFDIRIEVPPRAIASILYLVPGLRGARIVTVGGRRLLIRAQ